MFKCWNCQGTGLIYFEGEDLDYGTMTFGDDCPICHGKPWLLVQIENQTRKTLKSISNLFNSLRKKMKIVGPTIECGKPAHLVSFHGEHPEPYSDEQLKALKRDSLKEMFGFVGCSVLITLVFIGLVLIL
jgi:hypothetical protein